MKRRILGLCLLLASSVCTAEVVRVDVADRQPWAGGQAFGQVGAYEMIRGTVHYEIDPRSASARDVTDIRFAPVNQRGRVEYSGPFVIVRPVDAARGNHATLVEVVNRGKTQMNKVLFETDGPFDLAAPAVKGLKDTTFFQLGYTLAWVGWQGRMPAGTFGLEVPLAKFHGPVRATFPASKMSPDKTRFDLMEGGFYCARDALQPKAQLRLQTRFDAPGRLLPRGSWRFASAGGTPAEADRCGIVLDAPAAADAYFSVVYDGEDAAVMGLGQAAIRDFAAHLKYRDVPSAINDRVGDSHAVLAYGYSQSARFLRDFLYRGFNAGPNGKRVFDGMLIAAAGAGRGSFNHRYAMPGEAGNSVMSNLRPVDLYPFAETATPDIDGRGDEGLLDRATRDGVVPKIINTVSSSEYWARMASLLHTTADGTKPVALGEDSRLYYFAGAPHAPRAPARHKETGMEALYPYNDNWDMGNAENAMLENLRRWSMDGVAPPASIAPAPGSTLVAPDHLAFPAIPGVRVPVGPPPVWQLDFGMTYARDGVLREPPRIGRRYPLLVPAVDGDGNELGGWRGPTSSAPLGTFTAWNWKDPQFESFGYLSGLNGAFFAFARTRVERLAANDPRPSIEERYRDRDGFMAAATAAVDRAIENRFLLAIQRDDALVKMGRAWDAVMAPPQPASDAGAKQ